MKITQIRGIFLPNKSHGHTSSMNGRKLAQIQLNVSTIVCRSGALMYSLDRMPRWITEQ